MYYSSFSQKKLKKARVSSLMSQSSALTLIKQYCILTSYVSPPGNGRDSVKLVAFEDASHSEVSIKLCYIVGLVLVKSKKDL